MKKTLYFKIACLSLTAVSLLSSCLKDNSHYVDYSGVGTLIDLPLTEPTYSSPAPNGVFQEPTYTLGSADTIVVAVNEANPVPLNSAVNVTLSTTDVTTLNSYNAANGTTYTLMPSTDYTVIGTLTVTIPANQRLAFLKIVINTAAIGTENTNYVLPVTIESASGEPIAQPYKAILYNVTVVSADDGAYRLKNTAITK
jgi:hypothetical protein